MKKLFLLLSLTPLLLFSKAVKVDEILTEKKGFKLDNSISYSNINRKTNSSTPLLYQTQNGDFVTIPTYLGESQTNQDYLNYSLALRYGVTKDLELFSSVNFFTSDTHFSAGNNFGINNQNGFNSLSLGLTYQVKKEDEKPSLLLGISTDVVDKTKFANHLKNSYFKGYSFFATSYYTVDPVVFLLKATYRLNLKKEDNNSSINNGEIFALSPQIYFAVNPYTSMNWGVKYSYQGRGKLDGGIVSNSGSSIAYLFGASYEINVRTTLNVDTEYSSNAFFSQNNISMSLSYKF